ncbi:MAG: hypothetical protein Q8K35_09740 [Thiobacillus sp.]|nr:hypothetical protein [Thiobacillus sp.]MDP2058024.1 hypothetical protein [Thiobacillus sp.]
MEFVVVFKLGTHAVGQGELAIERRSSSSQSLNRAGIDIGISRLQKAEQLEVTAVRGFVALSLKPVGGMRAHGQGGNQQRHKHFLFHVFSSQG